jgi:hypothetical protein
MIISNQHPLSNHNSTTSVLSSRSYTLIAKDDEEWTFTVASDGIVRIEAMDAYGNDFYYAERTTNTARKMWLNLDTPKGYTLISYDTDGNRTTVEFVPDGCMVKVLVCHNDAICYWQDRDAVTARRWWRNAIAKGFKANRPMLTPCPF